VSQEAVIGLVYAVASALLILFLSRAPHGAERLKDVLVGSLLLSGWGDVVRMSLAYGLIGGAHFALRKRFIELSWRPESAEAKSSHVALWDFLFYALFGVTITLSVQVAGVLLVFSYLIAPALITSMFGNRLVVRLVSGWALAALASALGLWASWSWDVPTGAAIVVAFGALLATAPLVRLVTTARSNAQDSRTAPM
jgi:zinc/manganese transport system permease protein